MSPGRLIFDILDPNNILIILKIGCSGAEIKQQQYLAIYSFASPPFTLYFMGNWDKHLNEPSYFNNKQKTTKNQVFESTQFSF